MKNLPKTSTDLSKDVSLTLKKSASITRVVQTYLSNKKASSAYERPGITLSVEDVTNAINRMNEHPVGQLKVVKIHQHGGPVWEIKPQRIIPFNKNWEGSYDSWDEYLQIAGSEIERNLRNQFRFDFYCTSNNDGTLWVQLSPAALDRAVLV